jgi:hypothetical protein
MEIKIFSEAHTYDPKLLEIEMIAVQGQPRQQLAGPISKMTRAKWTGGE